MSSLALMEIQHALYSKLTGDGVLMGMVTGVYDVVPQNTALPYIEIGDGETITLAADVVNVTEARLRIDIWGDVAGRKSVLAIMNRIYALLHLGTLTLSGFQQVLMRGEQAETQLVEEASRMRGTLLVRIAVAE